MESRTTIKFWKLFYDLPPEVQRQARKEFELWKNSGFDTHSKGLALHHLFKDYYAVYISVFYRAIGIKSDQDITFIWIGSHGDYSKKIVDLGGRKK